MVLAAYVAGLISTPMAVLGAVGGMWWWRRLRRAQGRTEALRLDLTPVLPPPHPTPQDAPMLNRISLRSVPGKRRVVRGNRNQ